jgi:hypothetical protein
MTAGTPVNPKCAIRRHDDNSPQAVDLRDKMCIRSKPQILPSLQNLLEHNSVELCINLNEHLIKKDMEKTDNASSGARNCYNEIPKDQWLQVYTCCLYMADCANKGTGVFYGVFSFYALIGHFRSPFVEGRGLRRSDWRQFR